MKTIIVPTDFSPAALNAANYAADMAKAIKADLLLFHAYYVFVTYTEVPPIIDTNTLKTNAEDEMNELRRQLNHKYGDILSIQTEVTMGTLVTELELVCDKVKPYAVVMGTQGASATEYGFLGSQSVQVMKHLKWPVIGVPRGVRFDKVKKIGFACDFENVVESIPADEIKCLVNDFNAELHILNINKKAEHDPEMVFESGLMMEMLGPLTHEYHFITGENTDEGIINFAEKNNIDLLIVIPKRHKLLEKLIHKSHTKQLVLHSHVPVMALHEL